MTCSCDSSPRGIHGSKARRSTPHSSSSIQGIRRLPHSDAQRCTCSDELVCQLAAFLATRAWARLDACLATDSKTRRRRAVDRSCLSLAPEARREGDNVDPDLAYAIDIATRLVAGELTEEPLGDEPLRKAQAVLDQAADLDPVADDHEPTPDGRPNLGVPSPVDRPASRSHARGQACATIRGSAAQSTLRPADQRSVPLVSQRVPDRGSCSPRALPAPTSRRALVVAQPRPLPNVPPLRPRARTRARTRGGAVCVLDRRDGRHGCSGVSDSCQITPTQSRPTTDNTARRVARLNPRLRLAPDPPRLSPEQNCHAGGRESELTSPRGIARTAPGTAPPATWRRSRHI